MKRLPRRLRHAEAPLAVPTVGTRAFRACPSACEQPIRWDVYPMTFEA